VVWAVIYCGASVYAVVQMLPANADPLFRRIGWLTASGYGLCLAWVVAARYGPVWLTVPIIVGMLATLCSGCLIAINWPEPRSLSRDLGVVAPLGAWWPRWRSLWACCWLRLRSSSVGLAPPAAHHEGPPTRR
jgi:hypothetical protein